MSALTEIEIFECLRENLAGAADDCDMIARFPLSGMAFDRMRKRLKLVEGACIQAAWWREDTRWLALAQFFEDVHQMARSWLHKPSVAAKKRFIALAAKLRELGRLSDRLRTEATGRRGLIMPDVTPAHREGRPVQVIRPSGLILPMGGSS